MKLHLLNKCRKDFLNYNSIKQNSVIEQTVFGLLNNYVFFIDEDNQNFNEFIDFKLCLIKMEFSKIGKTFVYIPDIRAIEEDDFAILSYYNPELKLNAFSKIGLALNDNSILEYFSYSGNIKSGFLETDSSSREVVFYEFIEIENTTLLSDFIIELVQYRSSLIKNIEDIDEEYCLNAPVSFSINDEIISVDEEIQKEISVIINQMEALKSRGQIVTAISIFEKLANSYGKSIISKVSRLLIDDEFRILLPDYNIEIKLSHITKSLYIMFLIFPDGFNFDDLKKQRDLLLKIYISISNQSDLDKLAQNIDNLLTNNNDIYVHLSRIKSEFTRKMTTNLADNYIVKGQKSYPKKITLDRSKTNIDVIRKFFNIR